MTRQYETLIVDDRGPVKWVTLNRSARLNAINAVLANELADFVAEVRVDIAVAGSRCSAVGEPLFR